MTEYIEEMPVFLKNNTITYSEAVPEDTFKSIFKKSEHDEIMDELAEIKKKLDNLPDYIPLEVYPFPCPYPYERYPDIPYDPYPKPYYYGYEIIWTDTTGGCTS